MARNPEFVDLLSSDDDDSRENNVRQTINQSKCFKSCLLLRNPVETAASNSSVDRVSQQHNVECKPAVVNRRRSLNDFLTESSSSEEDLKSLKDADTSQNNASKRKFFNSRPNDTNETNNRTRSKISAPGSTRKKRSLQAGLVLEEDVVAIQQYADQDVKEDYASKFVRLQHENIANGEPPSLFEDQDFGPVASSIHGIHRFSLFDNGLKSHAAKTASTGGKQTTFSTATLMASPNENSDVEDPTKYYPQCWCKYTAKLLFKKDCGKAYFVCGTNSNTKKVENKTTNKPCKYFSLAFRTELMPWYRFGQHNQHVLVKQSMQSMNGAAAPSLSRMLPEATFSAHDLVQGKVGDCWFLSALAVVAERPDLIQRLFQRKPSTTTLPEAVAVMAASEWILDDQWGMVIVNLFVDGFWTKVIMDNFLPCILGQVNPKEEDDLKTAIEESLKSSSTTIARTGFSTARNMHNPYVKPKQVNAKSKQLCVGDVAMSSTASSSDPTALSRRNLEIILKTTRFLNKQRGISGRKFNLELLDRPAESQDLAYSKARHNQLWVPFLEKAYAKIHGSYQAISGGHIAEAFLDLTGAPTLQIQWHASSENHNNSRIYQTKTLWSKLLHWRSQRLPMGCGTDRSAAGIIGMHAYSILDVQEIRNVDVEFFQQQLLTRTLGNVSGFTEYDGKVRLLRIRNPHGKGEWKGDFSDQSDLWEKLLLSSGISLPRTMANDGTFWIDYDNFLLGFSNIDVVLAFPGNHAKSFATNFPLRKSNHRCVRAFEVSLIDPQPGIETKDVVEVYVMAIQKNRRGARQGRADRKKSYKVSDIGILVGEYPLNASDKGGEDTTFSLVHGQMFGFQRNGHYRLVLNRRKCTRMAIMPVSFGHPAATDKERSFVVRFNAEAPLMIREIETVPRMDRVFSDFLFQPKPLGYFEETRQGRRTLLWQDTDFKVISVDCRGNHGGTVLIYLCAKSRGSREKDAAIAFTVEANCRGMSCRTEQGILGYETIAKAEIFRANWRRYKASFVGEAESRLLMVLYQSGMDTEMGVITCIPGSALGSSTNSDSKRKIATLDRYWSADRSDDGRYEEQGIFHPVKSLDEEFFSRCDKNFESASWKLATDKNSSVVGHTESQTAIDLSPQQEDDQDLEEALRRSYQDIGIRNSDDVLMLEQYTDYPSNDDEDLKRAIELSLQSKVKVPYYVESLDMTGSEQSSRSNEAVSKFKSTQTKRSPEVIMLLDESEDEHEIAISEDHNHSKSCDRNLKRKLASEAAIKRLEQSQQG